MNTSKYVVVFLVGLLSVSVKAQDNPFPFSFYQSIVADSSQESFAYTYDSTSLKLKEIKVYNHNRLFTLSEIYFWDTIKHVFRYHNDKLSKIISYRGRDVISSCIILYDTSKNEITFSGFMNSDPYLIKVLLDSIGYTEVEYNKNLQWDTIFKIVKVSTDTIVSFWPKTNVIMYTIGNRAYNNIDYDIAFQGTTFLYKFNRLYDQHGNLKQELRYIPNSEECDSFRIDFFYRDDIEKVNKKIYTYFKNGKSTRYVSLTNSAPPALTRKSKRRTK